MDRERERVIERERGRETERLKERERQREKEKNCNVSGIPYFFTFYPVKRSYINIYIYNLYI